MSAPEEPSATFEVLMAEAVEATMAADAAERRYSEAIWRFDEGVQRLERSDGFRLLMMAIDSARASLRVDDVYTQASGEIPIAADRQPPERRVPLVRLRLEIAAWAAATFPDQTNARVAKHLQEEIDELDQALLEGKGIDIEVADSLILTLCMTQRLLDLAAGYDIDVKAAVDAKMEINRGRRWAFDPAFGYDKKIEGAA